MTLGNDDDALRGILSKFNPDKRFAAWREKFTGTFDTSLPCNCGEANIKDHAREAIWAELRPWEAPKYGPRPQRDKNGLTVIHTYFCDDCGATYAESVVEGTREYVPREKAQEEDS